MCSLIRTYTHKYDIRGRISKRFGAEEAYLLGRAFARVISEEGLSGKVAVVGRDIRETSLSLATKLIQGFVESGVEVIDIGICTTPMLRFAAILYKASGSVMVTASHNDFEDNGFKFTLNGRPFYDRSLQRLCDLIEEKNFIDAQGSVNTYKVRNLYIRNLCKSMVFSDNIKVIWIARNDFITSLLEDILTKMPGQHMICNNIKDFQYFAPDVIFDFDTDADRMMMMDATGRQWHGDETLALFALNLNRTRNDITAIFDLKASRVLMDWLETLGIKCRISRIGSCFIDKKMLDLGAQLGGETSGHFMFNDYNDRSDDGIYSAMRMVHLLSEASTNLQHIKTIFPQIHISKSIKISCGEGNKLEVLERLKNIVRANDLVLHQNEEDAILIKQAEGWYVIRSSQTENTLTVRCEGFDKEGLDSVQAKAEELLSSVGLSLW